MAANTLKVGFQLPEPNVEDVTGWCAAQLAIDAHNTTHADLPLTLVPVIDGKSAETGRREAQGFVADADAVAMLGPINSDMALATQDIYHAAGMVQISSEASSPELTRRGYGNFFRLVANDLVQGRALARAAVRYLEAMRIAVLSDGSGWGRPIAELFAAEARRLGADVVHEAYFGEAERRLELDEFVEAAAASEPDLVYFAVYWNKAHIIAHRLRDRGVNATFLGSDALKPYAFLEVPMLDREPPYHSLAGIDMRLKPSAEAFFREFALRYPMMLVAPQYAAEAYDAARLVSEAVVKAGGADRGGIVAAVRELTPFEGAIGSIAFDGNGDLVDPEIGFYRCVDGLRKHLGAIRELAQGTD